MRDRGRFWVYHLAFGVVRAADQEVAGSYGFCHGEWIRGDEAGPLMMIHEFMKWCGNLYFL